MKPNPSHAFGGDPIAVRKTDHYRAEYVHAFVQIHIAEKAYRNEQTECEA